MTERALTCREFEIRTENGAWMNWSCGLQSSTDKEILIHSSQANGEMHQDSGPAPVEHRPNIQVLIEVAERDFDSPSLSTTQRAMASTFC